MSSAEALRELAGREPECIFAPRSLEELQTIVAADDGMTLVPVGGGTRLELGHAPNRAFALLELAGALNGSVEHEPEDMTVVVPATATIETINTAIRASGQRLPLDPPHPSRASIGGTLATGTNGPLRTRYGLPRDLLLGMTILRSDGELVKSGGRVVKNVTGYDMMRLWTGSLGTLGVLVSASLRVQPFGETVDIAVRGLKRAEALKMANAAYLADCRPDVADIIRESDRWTLLLRVPSSLADLARTVAPGTAAEEWAGLYRTARDTGFGPGDELTIRLASPRTQLDAMSAQVESLAPSGVILRPLGGGMLATWTAGDLPPLRKALPVFDALRQSLAAAGGSLVLERMPNSWRTDIDPWGDPPGSFVIMQRLKAAYDARGRLNSGRFCGGI